MDAIRQDLQFALRSLLKSPGFTAIAILCMALGIAANVFVYSPVNALLLRPLPYRDAGRLMHLNTWRLGERRENFASWSWLDVQDVGAGMSGVLSEVGTYRLGEWNVGGMDEPERIRGARVSPSLFPMLGLQPAVGRFFRPDEERNAAVVILGHGVWTRKFGADSAVVGRAITVNGLPHTVIGIMAPGVRYPETEDLWLPTDPTEVAMAQRNQRNLQLVARLAPGVSEEEANAKLSTVMAALAAKFPDTNRNLGGWMFELSEDVRSEVRAIFLTMVGAVAFVLLIACSNVANLLLARGSGRQRELAVRLSMGATRGRLVRQLLTESLLLALVGGLLGALLGAWGVDVFVRWGMPATVPFWMRFDVDRTVMGITLAVTVVSGLAFGIVPALRLSAPDLSQTLKEAGGRGGSAHGTVGRLRATLVVAQLSLSLVLLAGAALMVQSFLRSRTASLGLDPNHVLTGEVSLTGTKYATDSLRSSARARLLAAIRAIPGVEEAALVGWRPISDCCSGDAYRIAGRTYEPTDVPVAQYNTVSPGYFSALRIAMLRGRDFTDADRLGGAKVVIVSQALAEREWPGADAVGQVMTIGSDSTPVTVVGVVGDVVVRRLTDQLRKEHLYVPFDQGRFFGADLVMRTAGDPYAVASALKQAIAGVDPDLPASSIVSMTDAVRDRMFEGRVYGAMFAFFGIAALLLASVGLYGVVSFGVSQRTQEVGVRMALGALPRDVIGLVLGGSARLLGLGLAIGVPAAIGLAQVLRGSLYGISASDPLTFIAIAALLGVVALLASWIPARRATRVDPVVALRAE
ncbi:MAG: ABC transporter permease [Gemmatimonadaceae bacterium]|nr:ABC transporter permease [Gemmatimonadaceae bacterium]